MSKDCVFCRIVAGELPSTRVYEDSDVIAFLDIAPLVKGHTLVIPRSHHERVTDLPPDLLAKLGAAVQAVARAQLTSLQADGLNVTQANGTVAGQVVPHVHFHVIPRFRDDGQSFNWRPLQYDDTHEMQAVAERIRAAVRRI